MHPTPQLCDCEVALLLPEIASQYPPAPRFAGYCRQFRFDPKCQTRRLQEPTSNAFALPSSMKTTIWQEQRKPIKAKRFSSSIVLTADPPKEWPKVATEIQAAYSAPNQLIPVRAPCASCSYPPSPTIRSRPRSLMPCHRFYLRPSRYMYTILHHWYRKHDNKIVKKPVANPRLPGITLAGSRDQSISPS